MERRDTRRKRLLSSDRGHPSLHVFASRLHLGSQLCLRGRERRRILLVVPSKAVVEKSRSASERADSLSRRLARPSFLSCTHRWRIILFFSRLKKLERSRDYPQDGWACQLSQFILGPLHLKRTRRFPHSKRIHLPKTLFPELPSALRRFLTSEGRQMGTITKPI